MTFIGSLLNKEDREKAAKLLSTGEVVGIFNRGVCALWFDGGNVKSVEKIWKIKGEKRKQRPVSLTLGLEEFISMIDINLLHPDVKKLLNSPDFKDKVGSLCFIRAPVLAQHQKSIPDHFKSFEGGICMLQNWDSFGHESMESFLESVKKLGVKHPAVTSMNETGKPELVDQTKGMIFAKKHDIPIFLKDEKAHPSHFGSYTIFTFGRKGIKLDRDGNIPARFFKKIFGISIDTKNVKKSIHPQLKFPDKIFKNLAGAKIRQAILLYLQKGMNA